MCGRELSICQVTRMLLLSMPPSCRLTLTCVPTFVRASLLFPTRGAHAAVLRRTPRVGLPPSGWLWVYSGPVRRWRRRFCVALTPGVLVHYKDETRRSVPSTLNLQGATLLVDQRGNERQFVVTTPYDDAHDAGVGEREHSGASASGSGHSNKWRFHYFRVLKREQRDAWLKLLRENVAAFQRLLGAAAVAERRAEGEPIADILPAELEGALRVDGGRLLEAEVAQAVAPVVEAQREAEVALSRARRALAALSPGSDRGGDIDAEAAEAAADSPVVRAADNALRREVERRLRAEAELQMLRRTVKDISTENFALREMRRQVQTGYLMESPRKPSSRRCSLPLSIDLAPPPGGQRSSLVSLHSAIGQSPRASLASMSSGGAGTSERGGDGSPSPAEGSGAGDFEDEREGTAAGKLVGEDHTLKYFEAIDHLAHRRRILDAGKSAPGHDAPPMEADGSGSDTWTSGSDSDNMHSGSGSDGEAGDFLDDARLMAEQRTRLPAGPPVSSRAVVPWALLRYAVGGDLSRGGSMTFPCQVNEPLCTLQRGAEEMEHTYLLDSAANSSSAAEAAMWALLFAVAPFGAWSMRARAPFYPLLGETYEWSAPRGTARYHAEHLEREPHLSAWHAEGHSKSGRRWVYYGQGKLRSYFSGRDIEFDIEGECVLELLDTPSGGSDGGPLVLRWQRAKGGMRDVIFGSRVAHTDFKGDVVVASDCGARAVGSLPTAPRGQRPFSGVVKDACGAEQYRLHGDLLQSVSCMDIGLGRQSPSLGGLGEGAPPSPKGEIELWQCTPFPDGEDEQYSFGMFALQLNEPPAEGGNLPLTDSRYREDMRLMEAGDFSGATKKKVALTKERNRILVSEQWQPRWFTQQPEGGPWRTTGEYWSQTKRTMSS